MNTLQKLKFAQRKRFWELAEADCNDDEAFGDPTFNVIYLRRAARYLRQVGSLESSLMWAGLHPYRLYVRLFPEEGPAGATLLSKFFGGEGWYEELEHWREGLIPFYILDLKPKVMVEGILYDTNDQPKIDPQVIQDAKDEKLREIIHWLSALPEVQYEVPGTTGKRSRPVSVQEAAEILRERHFPEEKETSAAQAVRVDTSYD